MTISHCSVIQIPKIIDPRGSLSFVESEKHLPFSINRIYYLYGVPEGASRGSHAHKDLHQLIIAVSGVFEVSLNDGRETRKISLSSPDEGLYVCPMIWRELNNFSTDAVCLVLASHPYDENDYFRNYKDFLAACNAK